MVGGVAVAVKSHTSVSVLYKSLKRKHLLRRETLQLSSSFVEWHHSQRRMTIVNELRGQYEDTFHDVKTQTLNYFTYKAARTVLQQLYEMNPPQYSAGNTFIIEEGITSTKLLGEQHELAERVMVKRLHLYGKWVKKCKNAEIYQEISDENLELMRERLMEGLQMTQAHKLVRTFDLFFSLQSFNLTSS